MLLIGWVIVAALLTLGFGYAAFQHPDAGAHLTIWDLGFLLTATTFLALFVRLLLAKAAATLTSGRRFQIRRGAADGAHRLTQSLRDPL